MSELYDDAEPVDADEVANDCTFAPIPMDDVDLADTDPLRPIPADDVDVDL